MEQLLFLGLHGLIYDYWLINTFKFQKTSELLKKKIKNYYIYKDDK